MSGVARNYPWIITILLLASCGFHLRGVQNLPSAMAVTYIEANRPTGDLIRQLRRDLRTNGIELANNPADNVATLRITENSSQRTLSVGADGNEYEYEISYRVQFSVSNIAKQFSMPQQELLLTRDYIYDRLNVLAANQEAELLKKDMQHELARLIIDRIAAFDPESN